MYFACHEILSKDNLFTTFIHEQFIEVFSLRRASYVIKLVILISNDSLGCFQRLFIVTHSHRCRDSHFTARRADGGTHLTVVLGNGTRIQHGAALESQCRNLVGTGPAAFSLGEIILYVLNLTINEIIDFRFFRSGVLQRRRVAAAIINQLRSDERHTTHSLHQLKVHISPNETELRIELLLLRFIQLHTEFLHILQ
ncbi:unknown [Bacteroides intestinalis CAG:315]|nr:unknown [Bacteroides intestinalis CAG:315]